MQIQRLFKENNEDMKNKPEVSIIIVNYNGKYLLRNCLSSIRNVNYPKEKYEIVVVDNNSTDTSLDFITLNFPEVRIVESDKNLGFAGGCNLGVKNALGEYVVLLNTDTKVDKNWLTYLVKRIKSDKKIAAVNSKVYLYHPFVELSINSDIYLRSEFSDGVNFHSVGVLLENIVLNNKELQNLLRYRSGFYETEPGSIQARWTKGKSTVLIPIDSDKENNIVTLTIRSEKYQSNLKTRISINLGEKKLLEDKLESYQVNQYRLNLDNVVSEKDYLFEVQNAGLAVFKSGHGRDRGAVVKGYHQFYEIDNQFYNQPCEITAFSGVSVILRKDIYKKLGGFDELYFMYYEDLDLSLRFKKMGYKIFFEPKSVIYHIHAGSSEEWSTFFNYHVEKNYLATLVKHFPLPQILAEVIKYGFMIIISLLKMFKWRFREHWELYEVWKDKFEYRRKVVVWFFIHLFSFMVKRYKLQNEQKIKNKDLAKQMY